MEQVASQVVKAADPATAALRAAARSALAAGDTAALEQVLRQVFLDAYSAGGHAAAQQLANLGGARVTLDGVSAVDWSKWKPGDPAAGALLNNGGLQSLLNDAGVKIRGITGTLLDQLGNRIGDGVAAGQSVDAIGRDLRGIVGDPARAERIAHTETARAVTTATLDSYAANGVQLWDWLLSEGACPECEERAAQGPFGVNDDAPPLHPLCRCSSSPVADSVDNSGVEQAPGLDAGDLAAGFGLLEDAEAGDAALAGDEAAGAVDDLEAASDDDLAGMLGDATSPEQIDRIVAELDRRDAAAAEERKAAEQKARAAERRRAKADSVEAERGARYDELVNGGADPIEAYAEAYGKDLERVRIQEAMSALREQGYTGRNYEELCMSQFKEYAERAWADAEAQTRGVLLNGDGEKAGINPRSLFTGQDARARKYASEELLGYWQQYGRLTLNDFKAANLGQKGEAAGKAYYL